MTADTHLLRSIAASLLAQRYAYWGTKEKRAKYERFVREAEEEYEASFVLAGVSQEWLDWIDKIAAPPLGESR